MKEGYEKCYTFKWEFIDGDKHHPFPHVSIWDPEKRPILGDFDFHLTFDDVNQLAHDYSGEINKLSDGTEYEVPTDDPENIIMYIRGYSEEEDKEVLCHIVFDVTVFEAFTCCLGVEV